MDGATICFQKTCDIPWYMTRAAVCPASLWRPAMRKIAKLFKNGRSQAVRLASDFRFTSREVFIRKDADTGDVVIYSKPGSRDIIFALSHPFRPHTPCPHTIPTDHSIPHGRQRSSSAHSCRKILRRPVLRLL